MSWTLIAPNAPGQVLRVMPLGIPEPGSLIGAPVLTEEGYVVGVVTDRGGLQIGGAAMALSVDDVRSVLPK